MNSLTQYFITCYSLRSISTHPYTLSSHTEHYPVALESINKTDKKIIPLSVYYSYKNIYNLNTVTQYQKEVAFFDIVKGQRLYFSAVAPMSFSKILNVFYNCRRDRINNTKNTVFKFLTKEGDIYAGFGFCLDCNYSPLYMLTYEIDYKEREIKPVIYLSSKVFTSAVSVAIKKCITEIIESCSIVAPHSASINYEYFTVLNTVAITIDDDINKMVHKNTSPMLTKEEGVTDVINKFLTNNLNLFDSL